MEMAEMPDGRQNYRMRDHIRKIMKTAAGLVLWAVLFVSFALPAAALDWDHPGFEMFRITVTQAGTPAPDTTGTGGGE